ncbi:MAG: diguanylate cyclase [Dehalococcoidia bacterium]
MFETLGALSRLAATSPADATEETVAAACSLVRELIGAEDAYVVRSGDPFFQRIGDSGDPTQYEIKQRGYWHAWRESAAHPADPFRLLTVRDRLVEEILPLEPGIPATHVAAILPGDESNSEMLIVRGPWAGGLSREQVELVTTIRPLLAYLVGSVLDGERQQRLRTQMRALANIAESFSQTDESENPLTALATALARASGFAWVAILLFDPAIEKVTERAVNIGRHSNTEIAERGREGQESENSVARDILVARHTAWTRQPYCVTDVSDPNEQMLVNDELRPYYERAHIISMASFPVFVQDQMLGTITFCASEQHSFDQVEQEFLWSLVAQAGPTIKAFGLNRDLREAEQRLRTVFTNAPVFITVFGPDGTIQLLEGAGISQLGQQAGALVGQSIFDLAPEEQGEQIRANIRRGMAGEQFESNLHFAGRDLQTRYAPLKDEEGTPTAVIGVTIDVTEQRRAERELRHVNEALVAAKEEAEYLASHDSLTGVLSRRAWFALAEEVQPTAIAVIDVDRFKAVNDVFGHPGGDIVLRSVADRLAAAVRGEGTLGRIGGEEFGILFTVPLAAAERACRRAVDLVAATPCGLVDGTVVRITVSAGLAACAPDDDAASDAIDHAYTLADEALYRAKSAGRHRLVISDRAA